MKKIIILLVICTLLGSLLSQTPLTGTFTQDATLSLDNSPYQIPMDSIVRVPDSVTLTIEAGVVINIDSIGEIALEGRLIALGADTAHIIFRQVDEDRTRPFVFGNKPVLRASGQLELLYCEFDSIRSGAAIELNGSSTGFIRYCEIESAAVGIQALQSQARISHCTFRECNLGISGEGMRVDTSIFIDNGLYGIDLEASEVRGCEVYGTAEVGIEIGYNSELTDCFVHDNMIGVRFGKNYQFNPPKDTTRLTRNTIFDNNFGLEVFYAGGPLLDPSFLKVYDNVICGDSVISFNGASVSDLSQNCWCEADSAAISLEIAWRGITSTPGTYPQLTPLLLDCLPGVYPGDVNRDQVADMRDLLAFGFSFGRVGPNRPNASLNWQAQTAPDWTTQGPTGINDKHADCDGNGLVSLSDTLAILQNYTQTHRSFKNGGGGFPLSIAPTQATNSYASGDTVEYTITWGRPDSAVENAHGIMISLRYDTSQWNGSSLRVLFPTSWLGSPMLDLITLHYHDPLTGRLDLGWTRRNASTQNGFGEIGSIVIVLDDDISKRSVPIDWEILDVYAVDPSIDELGISPRVATLNVDPPNSIDDFEVDQLKVYPNPTSGAIRVQLKPHQGGELSLYNALGSKVFNQKISPRKLQANLNIQDKADGMYTLVFSSGEKRVAKRIVKGW